MINTFKYFVSFFRRPGLPQEIEEAECLKLLHIGDIPEYSFPYAKRAIKKIKPDIIIHTGDLVDNLKAGRKPEDVPGYKKKVKYILDAMINSTATEIYIVPGNNDIEEVIREKAPDVKIIDSDTVLFLYNRKVNLCHRVMDITKEADIYLYGHGLTGDCHNREDNKKSKKGYFNAFISPTVFLLPDWRFLYLTEKGWK